MFKIFVDIFSWSKNTRHTVSFKKGIFFENVTTL
jgi:hypothetical protein